MSYDELMEFFKQRRSCRSFTAAAIPEDAMQKIMEAGRWTPSSHNSQSSFIVHVVSEDLKAKLRKNTAKLMGISFDPFYSAKEILIVMNSNEKEMAFLDGSLTAYNMILAAEALGIGSCWVNTAQYETLLADDGGSVLLQIQKDLQLPAHTTGICYIALGYPAEDATERKRPLSRVGNLTF